MQEAQGSGEHMRRAAAQPGPLKDVNDSYGHATGDEVLKHIARQVQSAPRPGMCWGAGGRRDWRGGAQPAPCRRRGGRGAPSDPRRGRVSWRSPDGLEVVAGVSVGICIVP